MLTVIEDAYKRHMWTNLDSNKKLLVSTNQEINKYAWIQPTKYLKSIIDYLITRQKSGLKFLEVKR